MVGEEPRSPPRRPPERLTLRSDAAVTLLSPVKRGAGGGGGQGGGGSAGGSAGEPSPTTTLPPLSQNGSVTGTTACVTPVAVRHGEAQ